jgi:hypothetical protein
VEFFGSGKAGKGEKGLVGQEKAVTKKPKS